MDWDDFEMGALMAAGAALSLLGLFFLAVLVLVLWKLHPLAILLVLSPVIGGFVNIAIQRFHGWRRK